MKTTCCFTGHRPQKLPWGFNEFDTRYLKTKKLVRKEIIKAIKKGYQTFISGMALGSDMMCAQLVLELKRTHPEIKLVCALPCKNQNKLWNDKQKLKYESILKQADLIMCLHERFTKNCMEERNKYMVNNSSLVIALFNGENGGTKNTLEYAKTQGKEIVIIEPIKEDIELKEQKILEDRVNYWIREDKKSKQIKNIDELTEDDLVPDFVLDYFNNIMKNKK